jgi:hypothetical protein
MNLTAHPMASNLDSQGLEPLSVQGVYCRGAIAP